MIDNKLVKVPIVDKNGKITTVRRRIEGLGYVSKIRSDSFKPSPSTITDLENSLLSDINSEITRLGAEIALLDEKKDEINIKLSPLREELGEMIDAKLDLQTNKVTIDSPIEEIKELNKLAFSHKQADKNQSTWLKKLHPKFSSYSYDVDHNLPIPSISFDYLEEIDQSLITAMMAFVDKLSDGRDEVIFDLGTAGDDSYNIGIETDTKKTHLLMNGNFDKRNGNLAEILDYVSKNLPIKYPAHMTKALYPENNI